MLNHYEIVAKLAWLCELQDILEHNHEDLLLLYQRWDWLKMVIEHEQGLDETDEFTVNGDYLDPFVTIVDTLDHIKSASKELSELLGDEIQSFSVPGETYHYLYVPKNKHLVYGFVTPGQFVLPGDRCHVFKIYLREEKSHLNLTWDENDDSDLV